MTPVGVFHCTVKIHGQTRKLDLIVIKQGKIPLFGRSWLRAINLNWAEIHAVKAAAALDRCNDRCARPAQIPPVKSSTPDLPPKVKKITQQYSDVFAEDIGKLDGFKAKLHLDGDAAPKFMKARVVPFALKAAVKSELDNLEQQGIIFPVATSEWATPIVPVPKPNKGVRICADFKVTVNPVLKPDQYPLPRIDDIFSTLAGGEKFSKIDLRQAYLHYEVEPESQKYLTINTEHGLYRYTRLVYGIKDAPSKWQKAIEQVLAGIPNVKVILDDMIITGKNESEHLATLEKVLKRLRKHNLRANLKKCAFFQNSIEFCGHVIDAFGLHETEKKVEAITSAKKPENVAEVQAFCGLVNYYRKFLPNISHVLRPLYALTEKAAQFKWSAECESAFTKAKNLVASKQVLTHYDPQLPVIIQTDACEAGISGVMSHIMPTGEEKPVIFISRALSKSERNYSQLDREALAIYWTLKKLHRFLFLKKFTLVTDCQALTSIFHPCKQIPQLSAQRLQRYAIYLSGMDYEIKFRKSTENSNADGLSRLPAKFANNKPDETDMFMINHLDGMPVDVASIREHTKTDPILRKVFQSIQTGYWNINSPNVSADELKFYQFRTELTTQQDCIMRGIRVVIPKSLRENVLHMLHDAHCGITKTKAVARTYVWWPSIDKDIERLTNNCAACSSQRNNPPATQVHPWEFPTRAWQRLHIDFAGPIEGKQLLCLQDAHSKFPEIKIMTSITSKRLIDELHEIFTTHGLPEQIHTDNGPSFKSAEFSHFCKKYGIRHSTSSPYHPQTNGQAERLVQSIKKYLKKTKNDRISLTRRVQTFLFSYRNSPHATTSEIPAVLLMGRRLRCKLDLLKPDLCEAVAKKQQNMQGINRKLRCFVPGEDVLTRAYAADKWERGEILRQTGPLSYEVKTEDKVHKRHADQLVSNKKQTEYSQESNVRPTRNRKAVVKFGDSVYHD